MYKMFLDNSKYIVYNILPIFIHFQALVKTRVWFKELLVFAYM